VTETTAAPEAHRRPSSPEQAHRRHLQSDPLRRKLLALADTTAVGVMCLVLGLLTAADVGAWALAALPLWLVLAKLHGLYDRDHRSLRHLTVDEVPSILSWAMSGTFATLVILYAGPGAPGYFIALGMFGTAVGADLLLRVGARALWRLATLPERALIVGTGPLADMTRRKLSLFTDMHIDAVDGDHPLTAEEVRSDPRLDHLDRVLVAATPLDEKLVAELLRTCRERQLKLSVVPPTGAFGTAVQLTRVADLPIVEYNTWDISRSTLLLKRSFDASVSAVALAALSPLLALVALAIVASTRSSPFFVQRRAGLNGKPFPMFKFRTMVPDAEERLSEVVSLDDLDEPMFKLSRDPRVTRIGSILRRTSLDELPQLANVLRGEMSLVGPRPEQVELVERYRPEHRFRLEVKPGITGPMQVFGRGELTFEERLAVERDYIENLSLGRDLRILAMTISAVAGGKGAY
jgi:exopolysaccharide biosynthesis polyprenyl glycosylphosphotransferase